MTVAEWTQSAASRLRDAGIEAAAMEAVLLAAHVLGWSRSTVLAHPETPIPEEAAEYLIQRRLSMEPLAYVLGSREFFGRVFRVGRGLLVPRHETETLVECALRWIDSNALQHDRPLRILDWGFGSGCIGITLKLERPSIEVVALDISHEALRWAELNADLLAADVTFRLGDLDPAWAPIDLIVANPPYIRTSDPIGKDVRLFEPPEALFAGPDGLDAYKMLAILRKPWMRPGGCAMVELGIDQAETVTDVFESEGWQFVEIVDDLGKRPRVAIISA